MKFVRFAGKLVNLKFVSAIATSEYIEEKLYRIYFYVPYSPYAHMCEDYNNRAERDRRFNEIVAQLPT